MPTLGGSKKVKTYGGRANMSKPTTVRSSQLPGLQDQAERTHQRVRTSKSPDLVLSDG